MTDLNARARTVVELYNLCITLKDKVRTGWIDWNVKRERVESVAEHIYGTLMLAIFMKSQFPKYDDIDIFKVMYMLAIHELGEIIIGDLTPFQISKEEKEIIEHKAVHDILEPLIVKEQIEQIFLEFDAHETKEAKFAYQCDKLECDMQSKAYDLEGCVDLKNQQNNPTIENDAVRKLLDQEKNWSDMWIEHSKLKNNYDACFLAVANETKLYKNKINNSDKENMQQDIFLETDRLLYRKFTIDDVDDLVDGLNNLNVSKYLASVPYPYTKEDAIEYINYSLDNNLYNFAIVLKENNKVIGSMQISNIDYNHGTAAGGIWINEKYQGKGYGTEAWGMRIRYAFNNLKLRKLENGYFKDNIASFKMQEKFGYKNEGIKRKKFVSMSTGNIEDEYITGLLKEEWIDYKEE